MLYASIVKMSKHKVRVSATVPTESALLLHESVKMSSTHPSLEGAKIKAEPQNRLRQGVLCDHSSYRDLRIDRPALVRANKVVWNRWHDRTDGMTTNAQVQQSSTLGQPVRVKEIQGVMKQRVTAGSVPL